MQRAAFIETEDKEKQEKGVLKRNILGRKRCKMKMKAKGWKAAMGLHEPLGMLCIYEDKMAVKTDHMERKGFSMIER